MITSREPDPKLLWTKALQHMECALEILDETDAPAQVGSHLDLAICRLENVLGDFTAQDVHQLRRHLQEEWVRQHELEKATDAFWDNRS